ncbi:MAG TPA: pyridoxal phosphate-dependent aminotransferase [Gammaproteobacteria bacterium]|nr:pyridoxal phosphate-dependent aminotransferase [Gammaproteobacteria bacterium]|tara:strand:+ start:683 stop:1789 length:1107 start_codon:yes stop_codon:yes gene_type:complete
MPEYRTTSLAKALPATVPFVGPEAQERLLEKTFSARIGANENVFGPSANVTQVISEMAAQAWKYGDPEFFELRQALAEHYGVGPEHIMAGEGIDGLFGYLVRLFVGPADKVVTSAGAYPTFNFHVAGYGGELITVPYQDDHEDTEALIEAAKLHNPKLVYLANPDNPMGTWWESEVVEAMVEKMPRESLLVLDEAYGEFAPGGVMPSIDPSDNRVLRFRTFSKAYGLAGIRVGYAIGEPGLINEFNKIRNHFGLGCVAQAACVTALSDTLHLNSVVAGVREARESLYQIASDNGLEALASATNFVAIDCGRDGDFAKAVLDSLVAQGIFVRMPGVAPLNRCIRVSVGYPEDLALFATALPKALETAAR